MARLFKQTITAILQNAMAPFGNGVFMEAEFGSHGLAKASRPHTTGSRGTAQIASGQRGDDERASPSTSAPADLAPTARSAGLSHLHLRQALCFRGPSADLCGELAFQMTTLREEQRASRIVSSAPCDRTLPFRRRSICRGDRATPAVIQADQTDIDVLTDTGSPRESGRRTTHESR